MLCGSSLYYQKKKGESVIDGPILIKDGNISVTTEQPNPKKKKIAWKVTAVQEDGASVNFFFSVKDENQRKDWMAVMTQNVNKDSLDIIMKVKQSNAMRIKKNVSSAVATSATGKDIIRKFVGKKALRGIDIVKDLAMKYTGGDKKRVTDLENAIIKLVTKAILLWQNGDINEEDVSEVISSVRSLWVSILNYGQMNFTYDAQTIKTYSNELLVGFTTILAPYLTEKTLGLLKETISFLSQDQFLDYLFLSDTEEQTRKDIVALLNTDWAKQRFQV